jgi:gluconolactonase
MRKHPAAIAARLCVLAPALVFAQTAVPRLPPAPPNPPAASLQAPLDPGYAALIATCRTPPPARGGPGGARGGARGASPPQGVREYAITDIPGVIGAGRKWTFVWQQAGNNGDGIVGTDDGGVLVAQNDSSKVVKLAKNGAPSVAYSDTHTGGALSMSSKKDLFIVERGLRMKVEQLAPRRRVLTDSFQGEPLDCVGGVINDLTADSKGNVYFTMGGLFRADSKGLVTRYGENLTTNGIVLSADEGTLYVTNGRTVAAFDVQADGSLTNQRQFVELPSGNGDGMTIDAQSRLYVTAGPGVHVVAPDGKLLGTIPAPYGLISAAFGGRDKKTMYAVVSLIDPTRLQHAYVYSIPMLAQGYQDRAK